MVADCMYFYVAIAQERKNVFNWMRENTKRKFHQEWGIPLDSPTLGFSAFSPLKQLSVSNQRNPMQ